MFRLVFFFLLLINLHAEDCISCHTIEQFDKTNHNFECSLCHLEEDKRTNYNHQKDIVLHPDSLNNAEIFCASCHRKDIDNIKHSLHGTLKNEINLTRNLWGVKENNVTINSLPLPKDDIHNTQDLVDDFLRRKCIKCHIGNQGSGENGMFRGKGCMSCHMEYSIDGKYKGSDLTVKDKKPYAKTHTMSKKTPMSACLSCHNKNFVGTDYLGMFPKDFDKSYRAPIDSKGYYPNKIFGTDYHYLSEDLHFTLGMTCADCHTKKDIMEDDSTESTNNAQCKDCHKDIRQNEAHDEYHDNISCSTCHSSWQISNYELSVFRDDTADYDKWKRLVNQEDAYLSGFLNKVFKTQKNPKPIMPDWITLEEKDGIWYSGWQMRRWENLLIGNDKNGKIKILRPMFQYRISYRDKDGQMVLNDISKINEQKIEAFIPYTPHTTSSKAKSCESCHENPLLLNPYIETNTVQDLLIGKVVNGTELNQEQIMKLKSMRYKKTRLKMLINDK
jgi:hypothetical protein